MSFNPLDRIKTKDIDFLYDCTPIDLTYLIDHIRNSEDKLLLIDILLPTIINTHHEFCLKLIYDEDKYQKETNYLLREKKLSLTEPELINFIKNTKWGITYIIENANTIFESIKEDTINKIFYYLLTNHPDKIVFFKTNSNLHIRYLFMKYLIEEDKLLLIYENILDYLTSQTHLPNEQLTFLPELMGIKDISDLYLIIFKSKYKNMYCPILKQYILNNYPSNDIAAKLLSEQNDDSNEFFRAFKEDADLLFKTSRTFQFYIYKNYPSLVSKSLLESFSKYLIRFRETDEFYVERTFRYELGEKLCRYIDKYLQLSTNTNINHLGCGTTCVSYQIGDYCLKMIKMKWSFEDIICPDLYLIAKNYEEDYVRENDGTIDAGLEVQRYFRRSAANVPNNILALYTDELQRLGYYTTDTLIKGVCGDNCRLLDSYKQADCLNPEVLPDWFKEYPMVLVDRDCVYKNDNYFRKELRSKY